MESSEPTQKKKDDLGNNTPETEDSKLHPDTCSSPNKYPDTHATGVGDAGGNLLIDNRNSWDTSEKKVLTSEKSQKTQQEHNGVSKKARAAPTGSSDEELCCWCCLACANLSCLCCPDQCCCCDAGGCGDCCDQCVIL